MTMRTRATCLGFAIGLIAALCLACTPARAQGVIDPMEYGLQSLPPAIPVNPDIQPRDLIDALAVEVRTGKARGADTLSEVRLGICGLSLRLKPAGQSFPRAQTMRMVFAPDTWAPGSGTSYAALPYGFLKNCDITLQHGSSLPEPGWHALNVRIFYHMQDQGWLWRGPHNGWYRYQSAVHFYNGDNWWQAEYETPYDTSAEKYLQYFGTRAGGNLWLALVFNKCPGCDLKAVNLRQAFLEDGDFAHADFSYADLTQARLGGANLTGATFRKATLNQVVLHGQDLSGTDMSGAVVHDTSLHGANLSGANLSGLDAHNSDFSEANLSGALLDNAAFVYCDLEKANLENTQMRSPDKPQLPAARLFGSYLQGANLRGAVLRGAGLDNTDLRGADLSGAIVDKLLILHNIKTNENTICPDGAAGPCKW